MKRYAFKKSERLSEKKEFDSVFAGKKKSSDGNLVLYVLPNVLGFSRLGIVVSKRFGNAPRRNKFKRLIREIFRLNKDALPRGIDIVVIPARSILLEFDSLKKSFITLLDARS